jgi:hypothetical protein
MDGLCSKNGEMRNAKVILVSGSQRNIAVGSTRGMSIICGTGAVVYPANIVISSESVYKI